MNNLLRTLLFMIGSSLLFSSMLLYEHEENIIRNKLDAFWVHMDDLQKGTFRKLSAFLKQSAGLTLQAYSRIFGNNLFTFQAIMMSWALSTVSLLFLAWIYFSANGYHLIGAVLAIAFLSYLAVISHRVIAGKGLMPIYVVNGFLGTAYLVFGLLTAVKSGEFVLAILPFISLPIFTLTIDSSAIWISRKFLAQVQKSPGFLRSLVFLGFHMVIPIAIIVVPILLLSSIVKDPYLMINEEMVLIAGLASLGLVGLNLAAILLCFLILLVAATLILYRITLPILNRILYLGGNRLLGNKGLLWAVGTSMITIALAVPPEGGKVNFDQLVESLKGFSP